MSLVSESAELAAPLPGAVAYAEPSMAGAGDYLALMKPRVMSLVVFTALVGLVVAPGHVHPVLAFFALLCIAVGAGAAGALNMWYDADIDAVMTRTADRPIPAGRVEPGEALAFGVVLAGFSIVFLGLMINWLAAGLLAFTIFFYAVVYTMWLKRSTPQNIVIGGAAGAFPPMIGWAAATGGIGLEVDPAVPHHLLLDAAALLGAVALSAPRTIAAPACRCCRWSRARPRPAGRSCSTSLLLAPVGASPWLLGYAGLAYGAVAHGRRRDDGGAGLAALSRAGATAERAAKQLFGFSILYLFVLFAALLVERALGLQHFGLPFGRVFA